MRSQQMLPGPAAGDRLDIRAADPEPGGEFIQGMRPSAISRRGQQTSTSGSLVDRRISIFGGESLREAIDEDRQKLRPGRVQAPEPCGESIVVRSSRTFTKSIGLT